ncbi:MAG: SDR family oxidoreductase [Clostridia bacterium]|nr:SDR family oxidoreductase [Clostridia bacterium]
MKIVILTGGTSGIGLETAKELAKKGCRVYEFSRREAEFPFMEHMRVDISDEAQVRAAVECVVAKEGRIDILVNNAGFGISGAFEFTETSEAKRLMDVNLFGMSNCIKAVLPQMRAQKSGRIVNLSSVAGPLAIPFQSWYSISKAAVNALTMSLANEVHRYGVSVCCVMPGDIKTGFTSARQKSIAGDVEYEGRIARSVARMEKDEQNGMDPAVAGRFIARIATKRFVKPYNTIGIMYKACILLSKILPGPLIRFILEMMYAR